MKEIKATPIDKDKLKSFLFAEDVILGIKDHKDSFNKVKAYKVMLELIVTVKDFLNKNLIVSFVH